MKLDITEKQAQLITESRERVAQAMRDAQITIQSILAGFDVPDDAGITNVSTDPPQITLEIPEEDDDGDG